MRLLCWGECKEQTGVFRFSLPEVVCTRFITLVGIGVHSRFNEYNLDAKKFVPHGLIVPCLWWFLNNDSDLKFNLFFNMIAQIFIHKDILLLICFDLFTKKSLYLVILIISRLLAIKTSFLFSHSLNSTVNFSYYSLKIVNILKISAKKALKFLKKDLVKNSVYVLYNP